MIRTQTRIGRNETVHALDCSDDGRPLCTPCGAEGRYGRAKTYKRTNDAITCKRCAKLPE